MLIPSLLNIEVILDDVVDKFVKSKVRGCSSNRDLSETSLTSLPTKGLESLEVLEIRDTPTLRVFPSVYHFRFIRIAHLTYPHHCCAFQFPETHNPEEHIRCAGTDNALRADD